MAIHKKRFDPKTDKLSALIGQIIPIQFASCNARFERTQANPDPARIWFFSYNTPVARLNLKERILFITPASYSSTTAQHKAKLRKVATAQGFKVEYVADTLFPACGRRHVSTGSV